MSQDVFLRLYEYDKPFENQEHLRAWLIKVCINRCRELRHSAWSAKVKALDVVAEPVAIDKSEETALKNVTKNPVWQVLAALPDDYREAATLFYVEGLNTSLCAKLLGLPAATF